MSPDLYIYRARVLRWVDADTVDVELDLGLRLYHRARLRLVGPGGRPFDAWEVRGPEREKGREAARYVESWAPAGEPVVVRTHKDTKGKYGRWLAQVLHPATGDDLATYLVAAGHGEWTT